MGYLGEDIGKLGFGLMRLPPLADGSFDHDLICEMVDEFLASGFTYFDTAWVYTGSEEAIAKEMRTYISGEFEVKAITPTAYGEIFFSDNATDDRWYKAKLSFITIDEKTEKEKRSSVNYLVQAASVQSAVKNVEEVMGTTMIDYVIASITETKIMDVFEHKAQTKDDKPEMEQ